MSNLHENLFETIDSLVSRAIESTPIDLTITATIVKLRNVEVGDYAVEYQSNVFSAYSLDPLTVYVAGEEVYVLVPRGDFSSKKVILGKAAFNDKVSYADRQAMQNQWKTHGPNWLAQEWYWKNADGTLRTDPRDAGIVITKDGDEAAIGPNAAWRNYIFERDGFLPALPNSEENYTAVKWSKTRHPNINYDASGNTELAKADRDLTLYGASYEYIMIRANFETRLLNIHSSGEYGIQIECYVNNPRYGINGYPNEEQYMSQIFKLSFGDFNGARYSFAQPTPQQAIFAVPKNTIKGLVRVSLYQDEGWETDIAPNPNRPSPSFEITGNPNDTASYVIDRDNIFATDIQIYWCEPINLSERLYYVKIDAIRGTSLYNTQGEISHITDVPLRARLMYGNKDITSRDSCKFMWYRQKYSALKSSAEGSEVDETGRTWASYLPQGEDGWAPISLMMQPIGSNPFAEYNPAIEDSSMNYRMGSFASETATEVNPTDIFQEGLMVPIEKVPWEWKYMVVCFYNPEGVTLDVINRNNQNDIFAWEFITIKNFSSIHDFKLPPPYFTGKTQIDLRIRNEIVPWEIGVPYDIFNPTAPDPEKDWWGRWWYSQGADYDPMWQPGSTNPNELRYVKGAKHVDYFIKNSPITFKVQVFGERINRPYPDTPDALKAAVRSAAKWPSANPPDMTAEYPNFEIANLEQTWIPEGSGRFHITWHGDLIHHYNSDGKLRDFGSDSETQYDIWATVTPLDSSVQLTGIEWLTPDGKPVISGENNAYTMENNTGMCHFIWSSDPDQRSTVVHYRVAQIYDINRDNPEFNSFTLRINYLTGEYEDVPCEIKFVTAGGNGGNGTNWNATIWATNNTQTLDDGDTVVRTPWTWDITNHPRPLVINGNFEPDSSNYTQNNNYRLFLRPFVNRGRDKIENLDESDRYTYKVFWDVRYPNMKVAGNRGTASNGSFLKFQHVSGRDLNYYGSDAGIDFQPGTTNPPNQPYQAYTHSRDKEGIPWNQESVPIVWDKSGVLTYGAIEVQWNGPSNINGVTFKDMDYAFVVKAQIDIFYDGRKVQTLFSYYGVDILFSNGLNFSTNGAGGTRIFKPSLLDITWPREVEYSATGIAPKVESVALQFYYGKGNRPAPDAEPPYKMSALPMNLTPDIQELSTNNQGINYRDIYSESETYSRTQTLVDVVSYNGLYYKVRNIGTLLAGTTPDPSTLDSDENWIRINDIAQQVLLPRPFYFFEEFDNGALATDLINNSGKWPLNAVYNSDFEAWYTTPTAPAEATTAKYVRTIIYRLNAFGNDSINGWDGKGIDMNEEEGTIFAPTIGAGWKHPFRNKFTGVIMGIDSQQLRNAYSEDYGGFGGAYIDQMKYMTGLYGYQDGISSFGIMENGTAYFGRADRGGRIVIDGYNAQIYGGVSMQNRTGLDAEMRNRMRLSFIDFGGVTRDRDDNDNAQYDGYINGVYTDTDTDSPNAPIPTPGLSTDGEDSIQLGNYNVSSATTPWGNFAQFFQTELGRPAARYGGFRTGDTFSTPAIEIGSYKDWIIDPDTGQKRPSSQDRNIGGYASGAQLVRGITPFNAIQWRNEISQLEIPGYRRFLVTYDGTLYAMNGFFKGSIVGSNIVGSNFWNDEGTFGIIDGHFYSGVATISNNFSEYPITGLGQWSNTLPTVNSSGLSIIDIINHPIDPWITSLPPNNIDTTDRKSAATILTEISQATGGALPPFFVSNDGRVFCQEIHVSGKSSINIGGFHVIPDNSTGGRAGDVVSFGTLYLVGDGYSLGYGDRTPAVEAWGDFYLRGRMVNLGPVFFGGTPDKSTSEISNSNEANSMNSPISITPGTWSPGLKPNAIFPTRIGIWPLYFKVASNGNLADANSNNTWVTLARDGAQYMPVFSKRPTDLINGFYTDASRLALDDNVTWRLDQAGMWTDAIFFTSAMYSGQAIQDDQPMNFFSHALSLIGWGVPQGITLGEGQFLIKNISSLAPSIAIETPAYVRISAGRDAFAAKPNPYVPNTLFNSIVLETIRGGAPTNADKGAQLAIGARPTAATNVHDLIMGRAHSTAFYCYNDISNVLESFIVLNGINISDTMLVDEFGLDIGRMPLYDPARPGFIWIRGRGIALDGVNSAAEVDGTNNNATIRINRSFDGLRNTMGTSPGPTGVLFDETMGTVAMHADLGFKLEGTSDGTTTKLWVAGISADNQTGIYARFG